MANASGPGITEDEKFFFASIFLFSAFIALSIFYSTQFHHVSFFAALVLSAVFGSTVGVAEIISRYRDEPIKACRSFFGIGYIFVNALLSIGALMLIWHYPDKFGFAANTHPETVSSAILAGFGASVVMRTRLMVLKGADNKDVSIGPDIVIKYLLSMVDVYIDRDRAAARHKIVFDNLRQLEGLGVTLGGFKSVADYLLVTLLALQNLEDERKRQLGDIFDGYSRQPLPDKIKYVAMGFVFLTIVGENRYLEIIQNASTNLGAAATVVAQNPGNIPAVAPQGANPAPPPAGGAPVP